MSQINFSFQIKDYCSLEPLSNKKIEITNNDKNKKYPPKTTDSRGIATFSIDKIEIGDFFSVRLIGDKNYNPLPYNLAKDSNNKEEFTKKVLTPNNYQNHHCILYFKSSISLLFNGSKLCLLQGNQTIASCDAISGKELTIEEKNRLQKEEKCESFLRYKDLDKNNSSNKKDNNKQTNKSNNKDEINTSKSNLTYCCVDSNYQKTNEGVIPEGKYYIKAKNISINTESLEIYTNDKCSNQVESKTNRSKFKLKKSGIKTNNNGDIRISKHNGIIFSKIQHCIESESSISLDVIYSKRGQNQTTFTKTTEQGAEINEEYLNIDAPFAPGTYITLEAQSLAEVEYTMWGYVIARSQDELDDILNERITIEDSDIFDIRRMVSYRKCFEFRHEYHKVAFSLPMRDTEEFDKYYIIIFAYDELVGLPSINDPFIVIDMSFRVGEGEDYKVRESDRKKQNENQKLLYSATSITNMDAWNKLESICTVKEAIEFLKTNENLQNSKDQRIIDYYKIHPQLAGKIAYIYYRFDLNNKGFIRSIKNHNGVLFNNNNEYINDVKNFANKIAKVYKGDYNSFLPSCIYGTNTRSYSVYLRKAFFEDDPNIDKEKIIKDFIKNICAVLGIDISCMPNIDFNPTNNVVGLYNDETKTLSIGIPDAHDEEEFINFMDTIVHEFRHFYIDYIFTQAKEHKLHTNDIAKLIYANTNIYIGSYYRNIFNAYNKQCADCDIVEGGLFKKGSTYFSIDNQTPPIYYIQPSERDARIAAYKFRKKIGMV